MKSKRRQKHWRKWRVFKDVTLSKIPNSETPQYYWANICHRAEWIQSENIWCCQNGLNCALSLNVAPQKRLVVSGTLAQLTFWGVWKDSESDPFWKPTMVRRCSIPFNAIPVQVLTNIGTVLHFDDTSSSESLKVTSSPVGFSFVLFLLFGFLLW